ncbi:PstS family phosphate ABC transporter substrate-binding protein [Haloterrigena sp. SYSU A558-1]|uniref:PstS family phosphate ABC transporter substrate-binding protein n=1 Tax=Haloterrigena gelatinilytica TaxID=2741724 RepID=A0A8J8GL56_9EURY|nr:PstS family phosphate ABC transporter substrate-binding protein [Haloterrigena gelatinilytica]NUB89750.1 PstS family phosphate ABC transporter substrate-binding protein [Haloterrigena gelatinilytica]NUC74418.1 PstS family phosphate ABC transporter substrate-binding protein [Haloterrigena gelatinilytica]
MADDKSGRSTQRVSRRKFIGAAGAVGAVAIAGCTEETSDEDKEIDIAGSSTVYPLMQAVSEKYKDEEDDSVGFNIKSTGSGGGFEEHFCVGETDFNNASRAMKDEEKSKCEENDVEWIELVAATDALTVVINNENDWATEMTVEELAQIWEADAAETWSDVNSDWPDEEIGRHGADDTSGTYDYFMENVMGEDRGHTDDYQATENDDNIVTGVQGDQYAIGYFGFSYYYQNPDQVTAVAIDDGDGPVEPSLDTAASGEYQPLSRSLYTYPSVGSLEDEDHVADFARFFVEQTTNESLVADDVGYVPLTEDQQSEQMDTLVEVIGEEDE